MANGTRTGRKRPNIMEADDDEYLELVAEYDGAFAARMKQLHGKIAVEQEQLGLALSKLPAKFTDQHMLTLRQTLARRTAYVQQLEETQAAFLASQNEWVQRDTEFSDEDMVAWEGDVKSLDDLVLQLDKQIKLAREQVRRSAASVRPVEQGIAVPPKKLQTGRAVESPAPLQRATAAGPRTYGGWVNPWSLRQMGQSIARMLGIIADTAERFDAFPLAETTRAPAETTQEVKCIARKQRLDQMVVEQKAPELDVTAVSEWKQGQLTAIGMRNTLAHLQERFLEQPPTASPAKTAAYSFEALSKAVSAAAGDAGDAKTRAAFLDIVKEHQVGLKEAMALPVLVIGESDLVQAIDRHGTQSKIDNLTTWLLTQETDAWKITELTGLPPEAQDALVCYAASKKPSPNLLDQVLSSLGWTTETERTLVANLNVCIESGEHANARLAMEMQAERRRSFLGRPEFGDANVFLGNASTVLFVGQALALLTSATQQRKMLKRLTALRLSRQLAVQIRRAGADMPELNAYMRDNLGLMVSVLTAPVRLAKEEEKGLCSTAWTGLIRLTSKMVQGALYVASASTLALANHKRLLVTLSTLPGMLTGALVVLPGLAFAVARLMYRGPSWYEVARRWKFFIETAQCAVVLFMSTESIRLHLEKLFFDLVQEQQQQQRSSVNPELYELFMYVYAITLCLRHWGSLLPVPWTDKDLVKNRSLKAVALAVESEMKTSVVEARAIGSEVYRVMSTVSGTFYRLLASNLNLSQELKIHDRIRRLAVRTTPVATVPIVTVQHANGRPVIVFTSLSPIEVRLRVEVKRWGGNAPRSTPSKHRRCPDTVYVSVSSESEVALKTWVDCDATPAELEMQVFT